MQILTFGFLNKLKLHAVKEVLNPRLAVIWTNSHRISLSLSWFVWSASWLLNSNENYLSNDQLNLVCWAFSQPLVCSCATESCNVLALIRILFSLGHNADFGNNEISLVNSDLIIVPLHTERFYGLVKFCYFLPYQPRLRTSNPLPKSSSNSRFSKFKKHFCQNLAYLQALSLTV